MHEQSLVKSLLSQVDDLLNLQQSGNSFDRFVTEVQVELGPLSGVEPLLLESAFEELKTDTASANAKLRVNEVALTASCSECKTEQEIIDFVFRCPTCHGNLSVTGGDGFYLVGISICERPLSDSYETANTQLDDSIDAGKKQ